MAAAEATPGATHTTDTSSAHPFLRTVCVFAGSRPGVEGSPYFAAAQSLGESLCAEGVDLVYGGGNVGLMGALASAVHKGGRRVFGVIPRSLAPRELSGESVGEAPIVCDTMHERKTQMYSMADAFVALPGGVGTLEELLEVMTWQQLGIHSKPIGLLNIDGYFDPLIALLRKGVTSGFIDESFGDRVLCVESDPAKIVQKLREHDVPVAKMVWMNESQV